MKFADEHGKELTGFEFASLTILQTLIMIPHNLIGVIMFTLIGALGGWLLGLTPLGTWIAGGLKLIHVEAQAGDIYKVGALLGFMKNFIVPGHGSNKKRKA